jgi:hypothetical protein
MEFKGLILPTNYKERFVALKIFPAQRVIKNKWTFWGFCLIDFNVLYIVF